MAYVFAIAALFEPHWEDCTLGTCLPGVFQHSDFGVAGCFTGSSGHLVRRSTQAESRTQKQKSKKFKKVTFSHRLIDWDWEFGGSILILYIAHRGTDPLTSDVFFGSWLIVICLG